MEHLSASVEPGTMAKLRELAGGPRKVGVYLSDVVSWLWLYREMLQTQPLSNFAPILREWIPRVSMSPEEQGEAIELEGELYWRRQFREQQQRLAQLEAQISQIGASVEALQVNVADTVHITDEATAQ